MPGFADRLNGVQESASWAMAKEWQLRWPARR